MTRGWEGGALVLEGSSPFEAVESWATAFSEMEVAAEAWDESFDGLGDDENVGQWLSAIGQGAAAGAATGAAAGPWGALVGGLVGGGLGAAQMATAPAPPRPAPPPPPRPAPPPPRAAPAQAPARPAPPPSVAQRPPPGTATRPVPRPATTAAPVRPADITQVLDQLASLVPVVAALAVQVGNLTQGLGVGPAPVESVGENVVEGGATEMEQPEQRSDLGASPEDWGEQTEGWGESGESLDETAWVEDAAGEWLSSEDRDVDLEGAENEENRWTQQ